MQNLWNKDCEQNFFSKALADGVSHDKLFYKNDDGRFTAYWEKKYKGKKGTIQSRNGPIGKFTENWARELFSEIAEEVGGHAVVDVVCDKIALPKSSGADVAICKTAERKQSPENILMIIEVKMSIVWNWEYDTETENITCIGDYESHRGTPSLLRSDSMLKAIGKAANIRLSSYEAAKIPIIILGNTPITKNYQEKVNTLKKGGVIQGFWSVNPDPLDNGAKIDNDESGGFFNFHNYGEFKEKCLSLLSTKKEFFHGYYDEKDLGEMIKYANNEISLECKARKFLDLLREKQ